MSQLADALRAQRMELAGEVHDQIIPPLFAARMQLEALIARLDPPVGTSASHPGGPQPAQPLVKPAELQRAVDLIQLAISESRQLLSGLAPHEAGPEHWNAQLHQALGGREVELHQVGDLPWEQIDSETAITLASIAAEAIRNAVRHGQPRHIHVQAGPLAAPQPVAAGEQAASAAAQACYQVAIIDDGRGFDPSVASGHHGLQLMRFRAAAIGGQMELSSQPGGPTRVCLQWPLKAHLSD